MWVSAGVSERPEGESISDFFQEVYYENKDYKIAD